MRTLLFPLSLALPLAPAAAQPATPADATAKPAAEQARPDRAAAQPTPFAAAAVDDAALGAIAGREDARQFALSEQSAAVTRSSVGDNATTGDARVDGNAFQNMSGFSILNINTGNNVAINAAMTVNISIQPGP